MNINNLIIFLMLISMVIGAVDYCFNNKFKLGEQFKKGMMTMGQLTLSMAGIIILTPVIAKLFKPVMVPFLKFLGADPSLFAGSFFAVDMGGFQLSQNLALNSQVGLFSGIILSSMLGATLVYTLPIGLGIINKEDRNLFAKGFLCGIITIPLGCLVSGLIIGLSLKTLYHNLLPIILFSILIIIGLKFFQNSIICLFKAISKFIVILAIFGLVIGIFQEKTNIVFLKGLSSVNDSMNIVFNIAFTLSGAFCFLSVLTKFLAKPLQKVGNLMKVNFISIEGLIFSLANNIAMFELSPKMDNRGKIVNFAFCVSGSFILGDHLGFTAIVASNMVLPMIIGKFVSSIFAVLLALWITRKSEYTLNG